jgi:hypothetical protein
LGLNDAHVKLTVELMPTVGASAFLSLHCNQTRPLNYLDMKALRLGMLNRAGSSAAMEDIRVDDVDGLGDQAGRRRISGRDGGGRKTMEEDKEEDEERDFETRQLNYIGTLCCRS